MKTPRVFDVVCGRFIQDVELIVLSEDDLISFATETLGKNERSDLKLYLDELLSGKYSDEKLLSIWHSTPASIYFKKAADLRLILNKMREKIS